MQIRRIPLFLASRKSNSRGTGVGGLKKAEEPYGRHMLLTDKGICWVTRQLYPTGVFVTYKNLIRSLTYASKLYEKGACDIGPILVKNHSLSMTCWASSSQLDGAIGTNILFTHDNPSAELNLQMLLPVPANSYTFTFGRRGE